MVCLVVGRAVARTPSEHITSECWTCRIQHERKFEAPCIFVGTHQWRPLLARSRLKLFIDSTFYSSRPSITPFDSSFIMKHTPESRM